ncbi:MAG: hypothetical protein QM628_14915 [Propionicimonas sp.]
MSKTHTEQTAEAPPAPPEGGKEPLPGIATWTAHDPAANRSVPLSPRTGEPTRVWTVWVVSVASYLAIAVLAVALLMVYWRAAVIGSLTFDEATGEWTYQFDASQFTQASWLMAQFETEPGSLGRVLLAVAVTLIVLLIGIACAITGYYAYDGRAWTRWSALIALALSAMALMLNPLATAAIGLAAIAAGAVWLPSSRRYFAAWQAARHHEPVFSEPPEQIHYGPLPRYH